MTTHTSQTTGEEEGSLTNTSPASAGCSHHRHSAQQSPDHMTAAAQPTATSAALATWQGQHNTVPLLHAPTFKYGHEVCASVDPQVDAVLCSAGGPAGHVLVVVCEDSPHKHLPLHTQLVGNADEAHQVAPTRQQRHRGIRRLSRLRWQPAVDMASAPAAAGAEQACRPVEPKWQTDGCVCASCVHVCAHAAAHIRFGILS